MLSVKKAFPNHFMTWESWRDENLCFSKWSVSNLSNLQFADVADHMDVTLTHSKFHIYNSGIFRMLHGKVSILLLNTISIFIIR